MSQRRPGSIGHHPLVEELRETISLELVGLFLLLLGTFALISLRQNDPVPWLVRMAGWAGPVLAIGFVAVGILLMLRQRAGYWSVEALVGAELLLLGLLVGDFLLNGEQGGWSMPADGSYGGLTGWAVGSLLMDTLGRWPALLLAGLVAVIGVALLFRYTPLIYGTHYLGQYIPRLPALATRLRLRMAPGASSAADEDWLSPAQTPNFVPPTTSEADLPDSGRAAPLPDTAGKSAVPTAAPKQRKPESKSAPVARPVRTPDQLPALQLLDEDAGAYGSPDIRALEQMIETTLVDFGVPVRVVHVESGPTVTQFGVEPLFVERAGRRRKVRVSRIVNLADDLALALAAPAVRIEAPVPGRPYVGIEVPNPDASLVGMRSLLESRELEREGGSLALPLGRNTAGRPVFQDLTRAPHLLIAGATGSGKSVCINAIVCGLLMRHGPESVRFVMVDPKMVELPGYNGIPHLLGKVIVEVDEVMAALTWLLLQMDDRYQLFRQTGVRNIAAYNVLAKRRKSLGHLPYMVLVIDELADLMMTAGEDVERQICRLAQMARATGIHLVLATQRPSTDVVTGLIKANFPTRIAFAVTSQVDSRVVLDSPGAERLLGRGDMLLMRPDSPQLARIQGCFVGDDEISRLASYWRDAGTGSDQFPVSPWNALMDRMEAEDELIQDAIDLLRGMHTCSASMLQRRLHIGYPKAARLMEDLEARGLVGPDMGGGQGRMVFIEDDDEEDEDEMG